MRLVRHDHATVGCEPAPFCPGAGGASLSGVAADETDDRGSRVMIDLATAVALILVLEGLLWAVLPGAMKRAVAMALALADEQLRLGGLVAAAAGVVLVWLVRG
jgi:uncharacterized protein